MNQAKPSLREKMVALRRTFFAQLPGRLEEMGRLNRQMADPEGGQESLVVLHRHFHTIKGTSGSFALTGLNGLAAEGERLLHPFLNRLDPIPPDLMEEISGLLSTIEEAVKALGQRPDAAESQPATFELAKAPRDPATHEEREKLVYLCDDDPDQVAHLNLQLRCFGYRTRCFAQPEALRQAVLEQRPGAVIMDIIFPEGDTAGTDVLADLHQAGTPPPPAIFISARQDFDARLRAVRAGGTAYFAKPVKAMELVESLDRITTREDPDPYRVLVVDDEPQVAGYHAAILEDAGIVTRIVNHPPQVLEALREFNADLVLMDMYMPECTGQELAQVIRQIPEFVSLPIIYLSSETDANKQFSALRVGADGFLTKPIQPIQLVPAVLVRAERIRVLRSLMVRDSLTGLYNHTTIKQFLENALSAAHRRQEPVTFAMIDVDRFKGVNDTYGHPVGDQVLLALSRVLQQRLRQSDLVGRYGGEEFAVVMPNTDPRHAETLLNSLREDFAAVRFFAAEGEFTCTFSCGAAGFPTHANADMINEAADKALYEAKHAGRNQVVIASSRPCGICP